MERKGPADYLLCETNLLTPSCGDNAKFSLLVSCPLQFVSTGKAEITFIKVHTVLPKPRATAGTMFNVDQMQ